MMRRNKLAGVCAAIVLCMVFTGCSVLQELKDSADTDALIEKLEQEAEKLKEKYENYEGYEIEDNAIFDAEYPVEEGSVDRAFEGGIHKLDVELGGYRMEIVPARDNVLRVVMEKVERFQVFELAGELYVKAVRRTSEEAMEGLVRLYVPEEHAWTEAELEVGTGTMSIEKLQGGEVSIEVGIGKVAVDALEADKLKVSVGAGEIAVDKLNVRTVDAEVEMGNLKLQGAVAGDGEISCSVGNVSLALTGEQTSYNYDVECLAGNIAIGETKYNGAVKKEAIRNDANRTLELSCSLGNITVSFAE